MGVYKTLRDEVVTLLQGVNVNGSSAFVQVLSKPTGKFTGTPAATVLPSEVMSEYITVNENQRAYGFMVTIYMALSSQEWQATIDNSLDLVDAVMDALDRSIDLNGKADFLKAVPMMQWAPEEDTGGLMLLPSIHVVAIKDVNVRI